MHTQFTMVVDEGCGPERTQRSGVDHDHLHGSGARHDADRASPIDHLDCTSPVSGLGSKMGMDGTHKWPGETQREWGRTMAMDANVATRMQVLGNAPGS